MCPLMPASLLREVVICDGFGGDREEEIEVGIFADRMHGWSIHRHGMTGGRNPRI